MQKNMTSLREEMYRVVSPLVERMKAKYPPELNMDGLDPALTSDIADIVLEILSHKAEEIRKLDAYGSIPTGRLDGEQIRLISERAALEIISRSEGKE